MSIEHERAPDPCLTCPVLKKFEHDIEVVQESIESIEESYRQGVQETVADAIIGASEDDPDFRPPYALDRDELIEEFVVEQGRITSALERQVERIKGDIAILQLGCAGMIRLRAEKNMIEYRFEICGSHQLEDGPRGVIEPMRVRRRFLDES